MRLASPARGPLLAALLISGCNLSLRPQTQAADGGVPSVVNNGVGAPCTNDASCRTGLTCAPATHTCQPPGNRPAGGACTLTAECSAGLVCTVESLCGPRGTSPLGGKCNLESDCAAGLLCDFQGQSGSCAMVGTGDLGAACSKPTDCMGGLICSLGKCTSFDSIEPWQGAVCPEPSPMAGNRVLFQVPQPGDTSQDFYRLPYPNDIRKSGGKLSLTGHPTPGARYLSFDPVQTYLTLAEQDLTGFGLNPSIYFRLNRNPTVDSARAPGTITLVNITPGSPEYDKPREILPPEVRTGKGFYVCAPYVIVHPVWGDPLRPGETYAAIVGRGLTAEGGGAFDRDDDFGKMLTPTVASTGTGQAWAAYAPLRAWLADRGRDPSTILAAAVFTTQKAEDPVMGLRKAVREGAAPAIKGLVKCSDPGVKSPCDDGKTGDAHERGCIGTSASYDEYQGTVSIPVFQAGKKPYEKPEDGGGIEFDATTGKAIAVGSEDVCFTLTVPKTAAPAGGWPLVIYSHGTGGSYRSVVGNGLADDYAKASIASFGYDGALHANRRGGSERSPDELVYNFVNARGARDTTLQAGADLFVVARALEGFATVPVNPAKLMVYGHSQGGNAAALATPYEPLFGTAVMSGTGGTLSFSLLSKKKPVDVAAGIPLLLGDPKVDEFHPILNVLQMYFDRSDGVNFGRRLFREPPAGVNAHSVLHIYGTADTYAPVQTQRTYALSAGFPVLAPVVDDFKLVPINGPVKGNITVGATMVTAVEAQFMPIGDDGHFVSTGNPAARKLIQQTLETFVRDGLPTVGGP
jgi:dienelactone hydrolase